MPLDLRQPQQWLILSQMDSRLELMIPEQMDREEPIFTWPLPNHHSRHLTEFNQCGIAKPII